ncbi:hypothetical protein HGRIS_014711 [Hohenbuehelia grisea]|uniref:ATP-dependent DNA helicase II subunit 2 n=1 Tax=Hohenbuehelia grisea TaxID=104357 RepID=A0ABR3IQH3_9AGAR
MPAERAGYTVTMFLVDTSSSMGNMRTIEVPSGSNGQVISKEISHLEWALQFVKLKVQEMIYNGRKTDQCGVILFGSEETDNIINEKNGGYENVSEYIAIGQANTGTLAKLDALQPSSVNGDPIDALIVAIETQDTYLASKKTWTRKIVIVTDGENPIEIEDWEATVKKMDALDIGLTVVGVDFDDDELPFYEEDKSDIKRANETFYSTLTSTMHTGIVGNLALALQETARPDIKQTKSALMGTVLRLGDTETRPEEAMEVLIKTSKCTAIARPKSWKKFALRIDPETGEAVQQTMDVDGDEDPRSVFTELKMRSEYCFDTRVGRDENDDGENVKVEEADLAMDVDSQTQRGKKPDDHMEKIDKEQLIRGFKYGSTYVPCPDGQFPRLPTKKGIDICGFFSAKNFRRELSMSEIQYVWADPSQPQQQVALSSTVQAMFVKGVMAIARWVTKDGMDPKMGVLAPCVFEKVECLLWAQMPFADDVRKYTFASLDNLISKKGEKITRHPYIPTEEQEAAMDAFVDAMDLMEAGDKDEEGSRQPWFDTRLSYNPSVHRVKQAMFHCAVVSDIASNPLPPPHPETIKYFDPPKRVVKRARDAVEACKAALKVKEVPKRVAKTRKDGHVHARDDDDELLLLDRKKPSTSRTQSSQSQVRITEAPSASRSKGKAAATADDSATEDEEEEELLLDKVGPSKSKPKSASPKPQPREPLSPSLTPAIGRSRRMAKGAPMTPTRSMSPDSGAMDVDDPNGERQDPGLAPGRIIGNTFPLRDFKRNIAQGDVVSKAVEDLATVIGEIVGRPFSSRRRAELLECMEILRDTCLKEDEIEAWNDFLQKLKETCTSSGGDKAFWAGVTARSSEMGLISKKEAKKHGGTSSISEVEADEFFA